MFEIKTLKDGLKKIAPRTKTRAITDDTNKSLDTILSEKANSTDVPSKVSQLTNDTGFITNANASATYETKANASATYETKANASATYVAKNEATGYNDILTKTLASATYETIENASTIYETKANASATYETKANATATYETKANASSTYVSKSEAVGYDDILTNANASTTYETNAHASATYPTKSEMTQAINNIIGSVIQCGEAIVSLKPNAISNFIINFNKPFNNKPVVVVTPSNVTNAPNTWNLSYFAVINITPTSAEIVVKNEENNSKSIYVNWIAIGG